MIMIRTCLLNSKGFKNSKISIIDILISLFYYFTIIIIIILLPILGFTNPTPLNRNLVPEICKDRDVKSFIYSLTFNF